MKVPENKRSFIVTVMTAYMNGIETGFAYTQVAEWVLESMNEW